MSNMCTAAGSSFGNTGVSTPLAEHWDGSSWSVQAVPIPSGFARGSTLLGVSCPLITSCTAVGWSQRSDGSSATLIELWNGSSWMVETSPNSAGSAFNSLVSVACPSAVACTAVGSALSGAGFSTLAEAWDGTAWSIQPTPDPSGTFVGSGLGGVSCPSVGTCTAVGSFDQVDAYERSLAEHE
jgi:hypothetical protein